MKSQYGCYRVEPSGKTSGWYCCVADDYSSSCFTQIEVSKWLNPVELKSTRFWFGILWILLFLQLPNDNQEIKCIPQMILCLIANSYEKLFLVVSSKLMNPK